MLLDTNGSEMLDLAELTPAVRRVLHIPADELAEVLFQELNKDGRGSIDVAGAWPQLKAQGGSPLDNNLKGESPLLLEIERSGKGVPTSSGSKPTSSESSLHIGPTPSGNWLRSESSNKPTSSGSRLRRTTLGSWS